MQAWVDKIKNVDKSSELPAQIMVSQPSSGGPAASVTPKKDAEESEAEKPDS